MRPCVGLTGPGGGWTGRRTDGRPLRRSFNAPLESSWLITVPRYSEQGTWRLNQISVRDNALNRNYLQPNVADPPAFEVVRTENRT